MLETEVRKQFARADRLGWIDHFWEASARYGEAVDILLAIGSRETNLDPRYLRVLGDGGNGFGLMQIDKGSFPTWCASGAWKDARQSILKGAAVLAAKRKSLVERAGQRVRVTTRDRKTTCNFSMPALAEPGLTRVAIAAYNGGDWPAYHSSRGRDPDRGTTGQNYSADVLQRARVFREILDERRRSAELASPSVMRGPAQHPSYPASPKPASGDEDQPS
jgi:hypothetical protein